MFVFMFGDRLILSGTLIKLQYTRKLRLRIAEL